MIVKFNDLNENPIEIDVEKEKIVINTVVDLLSKNILEYRYIYDGVIYCINEETYLALKELVDEVNDKVNAEYISQMSML